MLEHTCVRTGVIPRLRRSPLGPYLDALATSLHHEGYAPSSRLPLRIGEILGARLYLVYRESLVRSIKKRRLNEKPVRYCSQVLSCGTHFAASKIKGLTVSNVCPTMQV